MYFPEQTPDQDKNRQDNRPRRRIGGSVVALCLCCALLGGVVGLGGSVLLNRAQPEAGASQSVRPQRPASGQSTPSGASVFVEAEQVATTESQLTGQLDASQVYAANVDACVGITVSTTTNIYGYTTKAAATGSGFVISQDGYIITNRHVVEKAAQNASVPIAVTFQNGDSYQAKLVGSEEDHDVAVLKIEAQGLKTVVVGDSDRLVVGEPVYAIGNPLGELTYTLTDGIVSALDRVITTGSGNDATSMNMLQTNCAINPGNSGGPLFNSRGEVIGITTAKISSSASKEVTVEGLGFAIPINDVKTIVEDLVAHGYVTGKPYMGVTVSSVTAEEAQRYQLQVGAYVESVEDGSCAQRAGLQVGDIIVAIDDTVVTTRSALVAAKGAYRAGETATLKVVRDHQEMELQITFDEEPAGGVQQTPQSGNPSGGQYDPYSYYSGWPFGGFFGW